MKNASNKGKVVDTVNPMARASMDRAVIITSPSSRVAEVLLARVGADRHICNIINRVGRVWILLRCTSVD